MVKFLLKPVKKKMKLKKIDILKKRYSRKTYHSFKMPLPVLVAKHQ